MVESKLQPFIDKYISDPNNPDTNYWLAYEYEKIGQNAAALSYYLRCAEISEDKNLVYEFAGRTGTMAIVSILIMLSQDVKLFIIMFVMNIFREGQETIIDPLYPLTNAPVTPTTDLILHIVIVSIEFTALLKLITIHRSKK